MIRCPDNQINASFIDILRIKWLVFLLWSSFFRTISTVASSEAPADYQPAPGRTDGIPERHQRQWIINPSLQICAWNFNRNFFRIFTENNPVMWDSKTFCIPEAKGLTLQKTYENVLRHYRQRQE